MAAPPSPIVVCQRSPRSCASHSTSVQLSVSTGTGPSAAQTARLAVSTTCRYAPRRSFPYISSRASGRDDGGAWRLIHACARRCASWMMALIAPRLTRRRATCHRLVRMPRVVACASTSRLNTCRSNAGVIAGADSRGANACSSAARPCFAHVYSVCRDTPAVRLSSVTKPYVPLPPSICPTHATRCWAVLPCRRAIGSSLVHGLDVVVRSGAPGLLLARLTHQLSSPFPAI
jgi:hypothetical protein